MWGLGNGEGALRRWRGTAPVGGSRATSLLFRNASHQQNTDTPSPHFLSPQLKLRFIDRDEHVYFWFPLLAGLSELTFDPRQVGTRKGCNHGPNSGFDLEGK